MLVASGWSGDGEIRTLVQNMATQRFLHAYSPLGCRVMARSATYLSHYRIRWIRFIA